MKARNAMFYSVCGVLITACLIGTGYSAYVISSAVNGTLGIDVTASEVVTNDGMIHGASNSTLRVEKKLQVTEHGFVEDGETSLSSVGTLRLSVPIDLSKTEKTESATLSTTTGLTNYDCTIDVILGCSSTETSTTYASTMDLCQYVTSMAIYDSLGTTSLYSYTLTTSDTAFVDDDNGMTTVTKEDVVIIIGASSASASTTIYIEYTFAYGGSAWASDVYTPYSTLVGNGNSYYFTLNWTNS